MPKIVEINFLETKEKTELEDFVKQVVTTCFQEEKIENLNFYLSVTLTSKEQIHKLNKEYRNVDKETDVLSFPMFEKEELEQRKEVNEDILGDIVISIEKVEEQAEEYGHSFERELAYMVVHGFYHLMGYDHIDETDKIEMRKKEENILNKLNIRKDE